MGRNRLGGQQSVWGETCAWKNRVQRNCVEKSCVMKVDEGQRLLKYTPEPVLGSQHTYLEVSGI